MAAKNTGKEKAHQILDCPVCYELPKPPVYRCLNGHIICNMCYSRISNCPVCRVLVCKVKPIRNLTAEKFLNDFKIIDTLGRKVKKEKEGPKEIIATKVTGTINWFNVKSGYGFIIRNDTKEDVFVHQTAIVKNNPKKAVRSLGDGEYVEFDVVVGEKGIEASNVTVRDREEVQGSQFARTYNYKNRRPYPRFRFARPLTLDINHHNRNHRENNNWKQYNIESKKFSHHRKRKS